MAFAENINRICAIRKTNLTNVIKQLKNGQSSYTTAINRKGSIPNQKDLFILAEILHCSVTDFFVDNPDSVLNQNNSSDLSNNTRYDNGINKDIPVTIDSKQYFFTLLDQLKNMNDEQLLEMINYADDILTKDKL